MDGEFGRRDNMKGSWRNYHEDRQYVSYQSGKESNNTWKKETRQDEVSLSLRAGSRWEDEFGTL